MRRGDYEALQGQVRELRKQMDSMRSELDSARKELADLVIRGLADLRGDNQGLQRDIHEAANNVTAAVNDGFREQRTTLGQVKDTIGDERADVADVLREIEGMRREAAEARAAELEQGQAAEPATAGGHQPPPGEPPTDSPADGDASDYQDLLDAAASVAYAELTCHRDTWSFLIERSAQTEHFRLPGDVNEGGDGIIEADVSGRTLIAMIDALWHTHRDPEAGPGTRALADRVYDRIGRALRDLGPSIGDEQPIPRILIDNRPPAPTTPIAPPSLPGDTEPDDDASGDEQPDDAEPDTTD